MSNNRYPLKSPYFEKDFNSNSQEHNENEKYQYQPIMKEQVQENTNNKIFIIRKPYLTLKERLTQVWFNYYTICLLLVVFKLWLFRNSLLVSLKAAKSLTYSECSKLDQYSTSISNLPHYISLSLNEIISKVLAEANTAFYEGLNLTFTIAEELIMFTIEMTVGTYACLLTAAVDGAVGVSINATESVIQLANDTVIAFAEELEDGLGDLTKIVNTIIGAVDDVVDFFTDNNDSSDAHESLKKVNSTIASLKNWSIPSGINSDLEKLYKEVPNYDDLLNYTRSFIESPFDEIKSLIQDQLDSSPIITAEKMFVPNMASTSSYCTHNENIPKFFEEMNTLIHRTFIILTVVLTVVSVIAMVYFTYKIHSDWKKLNNTAEQISLINNTYLPNERIKSLEILEDMRHLWVARISKWLNKLFFSNIQDPQTRDIKTANLKWIMHYVFSPTAATILLFSLVGILSVIVQYILLISIKNIDSSDLSTAFEEVSSQTMKNVNTSINLWANNTNDYILQEQNDINDNLLGWLHNSSEAINSTVSEFVDSMNDKLEDIFGGTPLYDPIQSIVGCVITSKLIKIEEALTWINNHTEIEFPIIQPTQLINSLQKNTQNSNSSSDNTPDNQINTLIKKAQTELKSTKDKVYHTFLEQILIELYISLALLGIWIFTLFFAIIMVFIKEHMQHRREKVSNKYTHTFNSQLTISEPIPLAEPHINFNHYTPVSPNILFPASATMAPKLSTTSVFPNNKHLHLSSTEAEENDTQTVYSYNDNKENFEGNSTGSIQPITPTNPITDMTKKTSNSLKSDPYSGPGLVNQTLSRVYNSLKKTPSSKLKAQRTSVDSSYPLAGTVAPIPFSLPGFAEESRIPISESDKENLRPPQQCTPELDSPFQLSNSGSARHNSCEANIEVEHIDDGDLRSILTTDPFDVNSYEELGVHQNYSSPSYTDPTIHTARRWN